MIYFNNIFRILGLILILITISSCEDNIEEDINVFTEGRDGNQYRWVSIGDQVWMADNLRAIIYADGTAIPEIKQDALWVALEDNEKDKAYCWYLNDSISYAQTYGALYTYAAATNGMPYVEGTSTASVQGICPIGWHLPSEAEWSILIDFISDDGAVLKARTGWRLDGNGDDNFGFSALPGGTRYFQDGSFSYAAFYSYWWSSTQYRSSDAHNLGLTFINGDIFHKKSSMSNGLSVRCLMD